jgi:lysophospholipase L1-like esterase
MRFNIRDSLFTRHVSNVRVLCPNRMISVGQRKEEPTDEVAAKTAALWGSDPVHPTTAAYRMMADHIEQDLLNSDARYTNPA